MKHLEIERRWLVKLPLNAEAQAILRQEMPVLIKQTYLLNETGEIERVRSATAKIWKTSFNHYFHTKKKFISSGINEEEETDLKEGMYESFLNKADPTRISIEKTRYHLPCLSWEVSLDVFHGQNEGLCILEIEMADIKEEIVLPPYLEIEKEITDDKSYSNYELSKKKENK